ncbi:hypothetical protein KSP39_PZI024108 [Platanthera zijinensis]|uniref:Phosphoglycerate mutase family protein n=1 Tax=Platanthera zijinensis TaxID=2320716 RepID=A0AAP0AT23_9ASPA
MRLSGGSREGSSTKGDMSVFLAFFGLEEEGGRVEEVRMGIKFRAAALALFLWRTSAMRSQKLLLRDMTTEMDGVKCGRRFSAYGKEPPVHAVAYSNLLCTRRIFRPSAGLPEEIMRALHSIQASGVCSSLPCRRNPNLLPTRSVSVSTVKSDVDEEFSSAGPLNRRRLILLRHAESILPDRFLRDHDRPLSKIGKADAMSISRRLQQMGWIPELILSSDANRTKETLKVMQEYAKEISLAEVHFIPSFYSIASMDGQTAEHLQKVICQYSRDDMLTVMCMGHNRGWEEAASMFCGSSIELKTCNAALLEATGKSWNENFCYLIGGVFVFGAVKPAQKIILDSLLG